MQEFLIGVGLVLVGIAIGALAGPTIRVILISAFTDLKKEADKAVQIAESQTSDVRSELASVKDKAAKDLAELDSKWRNSVTALQAALEQSQQAQKAAEQQVSTITTVLSKANIAVPVPAPTPTSPTTPTV